MINSPDVGVWATIDEVEDLVTRYLFEVANAAFAVNTPLPIEGDQFGELMMLLGVALIKLEAR